MSCASLRADFWHAVFPLPILILGILFALCFVWKSCKISDNADNDSAHASEESLLPSVPPVGRWLGGGHDECDEAGDGDGDSASGGVTRCW